MRQENLAGRSVVRNTERPSGGEGEGDGRGAGGPSRKAARSARKAQMRFCSDAQMPRSVKTALAVLTDRVPERERVFSQKMV